MAGQAHLKTCTVRFEVTVDGKEIVPSISGMDTGFFPNIPQFVSIGHHIDVCHVDHSWFVVAIPKGEICVPHLSAIFVIGIGYLGTLLNKAGRQCVILL